MAFLRPTRIAVRTIAGPANQSNFLKDLYAYLNATSDWVVGGQVPITAGDPGSYSFKASPPAAHPNQDDLIEVNFRNNGTVGTPDANVAYVGLNPDGTGDPIADTTDPSAGGTLANYSGNGAGTDIEHGVKAFDVTGITNLQYIIFEFPYALAVFFKDAGNSYTPKGFACGKLFTPDYLSDYDGNGGLLSRRIDGSAILGSEPGRATTSSWFYTSATNKKRVARLTTGNTIATTSTQAWYHSILTDTLTSASPYTFGGGSVIRPQRKVVIDPYYGRLGEWDFFKEFDIKASYSVRAVGGLDYVMHYWVNASTTNLVIHTTDGTSGSFDPHVDGVYT